MLECVCVCELQVGLLLKKCSYQLSVLRRIRTWTENITGLQISCRSKRGSMVHDNSSVRWLWQNWISASLVSRILRKIVRESFMTFPRSINFTINKKNISWKHCQPHPSWDPGSHPGSNRARDHQTHSQCWSNLGGEPWQNKIASLKRVQIAPDL